MLPNLRQVGGCADRGIHGELVQCCTPRTSPVEKWSVCGRGRTQRRNTVDELAVTFERPVDLDLDAVVWKSVPWGRWRAQSAGMSWNLWRHRGERFLLLHNCRLSRNGDSSKRMLRSRSLLILEVDRVRINGTLPITKFSANPSEQSENRF